MQAMSKEMIGVPKFGGRFYMKSKSMEEIFNESPRKNSDNKCANGGKE
jgi:hypothetical protein